jgi:hypothetical protein
MNSVERPVREFNANYAGTGKFPRPAICFAPRRGNALTFQRFNQSTILDYAIA